MVNEFHTLNGTCATLVPSGPGYENATLANQVCTMVGSRPGMLTVPGDAYTHLTYDYSYSNLWRVSDRCYLMNPMSTSDWVSQNFGILWVFLFGILGTLLFFNQYNQRTAQDSTVTLFKEGSDHLSVYQATDEEKVAPGYPPEKVEESDTADSGDPGILKPKQPHGADVFSWKNIHYEVPISGGEMRKLLDDVSGYVAPGKLTALMGESGAGKVCI